MVQEDRWREVHRMARENKIEAPTAQRVGDFAHGLGQMYGARRDVNQQSTKQVQVLRTRVLALLWLGVEERLGGGAKR